MALPPGWTAADVAAMSDSFAQSVDGLRSAEAVQAKTSQAVTALSALTAPL